jgi:hypothetical protein
MAWATFWVIFSQTHLVALFINAVDARAKTRIHKNKMNFLTSHKQFIHKSAVLYSSLAPTNYIDGENIFKAMFFSFELNHCSKAKRNNRIGANICLTNWSKKLNFNGIIQDRILLHSVMKIIYI